jgi:hypothetical protein
MRIERLLIGAGAALALAATAGCRSDDYNRPNRSTAARQNQSGYDRTNSSSAKATGTPDTGPESYATPGSAGSTADTGVQNQSGRDTSTSGMQSYRVSKVTSSIVTLEPSSGRAANGGGSVTGSSERQNQSGKDVTLSVTEFQRLANQGSSTGATSSSTMSSATPHVGDLVLVAMGPSNKPTRIQLLTAGETGGSGSSVPAATGTPAAAGTPGSSGGAGSNP